MSADGVALGVDLATATARCVAVDLRDGRVLASATSALTAPRRGAGGASRQEPTYAGVVADLLARVVHELGPAAAAVDAVCATGTSGTVVAVDDDGRPLGDALLYDDLSGADLAARHGLPAGSMLARMAVALREHPAATRVVTAVDTVTAALVGRAVASDTSHLLKAGCDPVTHGWPGALEALGLAGRVPDVVAPATVLGELEPDAARRVGLPGGVVVVSGMTDGCTGQLASGAVGLGDSVGVLGTTLVLKAVSAQRVDSGDGTVYSHRSPDGTWWPGGASNVGGGLLAGRTGDDLARLDEAAAARGPAGVVCYPLPRTGERFPVADPSLVARWSGDPRDEVEAHRALLEGVAFVERLGLETLAGLGAPSRHHVLAGGGSRSDTWNRVRAGVLAPVLAGGAVSVAPRASSAVGATLLAALALDPATDLPTVATRLLPAGRRVEPADWETDALAASYDRFLGLLPDPARARPSPRVTPPTDPRPHPAEGTARHG